MSKKILVSDDDPIKKLVDNSKVTLVDADSLNDLPINANERGKLKTIDVKKL